MADLLSVDEARSRIISAVRPLSSEDVAVGDALGRVVAEDVAAEFDIPPFDPSAMDGYALVAGPEAELRVVGESRAGHPYDRVVLPGEAIRISTGAVVPDGADAVVPIERVDESGEMVRVPETRWGANIRRAGQDVRAGQVVLRAGQQIGAPEAAMLSALGRASVQCARRPRVAVVATGDELQPAGATLGPGQIYDSNATAIAAQAVAAGADVVARAVVDDEPEATARVLGDALESADVVCVSGGVSVGAHDHVRPTFAQLGVEQRIWGVRLKPGRPLWFGVRDAGRERKMAFGLPGNPVSAMVTFHLFARPVLRALQGADPAATRSRAVLDAPISPSPDRDQAVRCRLQVADDGFHVEPTGAQESHVLSSMIGAGALALIPPGESEIPPGTQVTIEFL